MPPIIERPQQTPLQLHVLDWSECRRCSLHEKRQQVCISRGRVPCDALFIGEAPGFSEDAIGEPFVGPAGMLLDKIIARAEGPDSRSRRVIAKAFINLVGCIPLDEDGQKTMEPMPEAIAACAPRLHQFMAIAQPRLVVCVGQLATTYVVDDSRMPDCFRRAQVISIDHPAYLIRMSSAQQGSAIRRNEDILKITFAKL